MHRIALVVPLAAVSGCLGVPDPTRGSVFAGNVDNQWDAPDEITLQLRADADGVDEMHQIPAHGSFELATTLPPGTSYSITVVQPDPGICKVSGATGLTEPTTRISVACEMPEIKLSGPMDWRFQPADKTQMIDATAVMEDVTITIEGHLARAEIDGRVVSCSAVPVSSGPALAACTAPSLALPFGQTPTAMVSLFADGGLSRRYDLTFTRGTRVIEANPVVPDEERSFFGVSIAMSGDLVAVGANGEDSLECGVEGREGDDEGDKGVRVFDAHSADPTPPMPIQGPVDDEGDDYGGAVALSGTTLAVGARYGRESGSGAVYVYLQTDGRWEPQAISLPDLLPDSELGASVALSGDMLVVGAPSERALGGIPPEDGLGAVHVFVRTGGSWDEETFPVPSTLMAGDRFGASVALIDDTPVVGAPRRTLVVGAPSRTRPGVVYVFARNETSWVEQKQLKGTSGSVDRFGTSVALSQGATGDLSLAIGAIDEVGTVSAAGAAYVFLRANEEWTPQAHFLGSTTENHGHFGCSVALAGDLLVVGAPGRDPGANVGVLPGAAYLFTRNQETWQAPTVLLSPSGGRFGYSVALSESTLVIGAISDSTNATDGGAIRIYH